MSVARCLLFVGCFVFAVCCVMFVVRFVVNCLLFVGCWLTVFGCLSFAVCCWLPGVCCVLCAVPAVY